MKTSLRAGFVYFVIVFAIGFVLGAIRVLVLVPRIGELTAVLIELPLMLTASWIVCKSLITRFRVAPEVFDRIVMGASAFGFLLVAEIALSTCVFGSPIESTFVMYLTLPGLVGLCGQLAFAAIPLVQLLRL
jgi:hypothetical protein